MPIHLKLHVCKEHLRHKLRYIYICTHIYTYYDNLNIPHIDTYCTYIDLLNTCSDMWYTVNGCNILSIDTAKHKKDDFTGRQVIASLHTGHIRCITGMFKQKHFFTRHNETPDLFKNYLQMLLFCFVSLNKMS